MMKKTIAVATIVLVMTVLLVMTASATIPDIVNGYALNVGGNGVDFWYDICDPYLQGQVVQPFEHKSRVVKGTFTARDVPGCHETFKLVGTCEITLIPVETVGDPESKRGRGVVGRCTGDLMGYHATMVIDELYNYVAKYHIDP